MSSNTALIPTIVTETNVAPWYDDYNPSKNYKRILVNPSLGVQSRELTQMQTSIQYDQAVYASHLFQDGSRIKGGEFKIDLAPKFVRIKDTNAFGNTVTVSNLLGTQLTGASANITAYVASVATGTEAGFPDTKTLILKYISASANGSVTTFQQNENLTANNGFTAKVLNSANCVGNASMFTINEGFVFARGFPVRFDTQSIILDKYSNRPTCKVGFLIEESIVDSSTDTTLLDPASGFNNYAAPGASRLKITATLAKVSTANTTVENFIELFNIKDGIVQEKYERTQYNDIRDEFAKRTYDESGDYVVRGFGVRVKPHLDTDETDGFLTVENGGNTSLLAIGIEPGVAYVRGYEYENLVTRWVSTPKAIDYVDVENVSIATNYGNYVIVNELSGVFDVKNGTIVDLYDTAQGNLTDKTYSTGSPSGNKIGEARVKHIEFYSGTIGLPSAQWKIYLYDVVMLSGAFSAVRSIYLNNSSGTADAFADMVLSANTATVYDTEFNTSIYRIPLSSIRRLRDSTGSVESSYDFVKSFDVTVAGAGTFTITTGASDEIWPYGAGTLNSTQKRDFIVVNNTTARVTLSGTVSGTSGNTAITGSSTLFTTELAVGDLVEISSNVYRVANIGTNTGLTLSSALITSPSGATIKKYYPAGYVFDYTVAGSTGTTRTITINSTTSATFDLKETLDSSTTATVICRLSKTNVQEKKKNLISNRYVKINIGTSTNGTSGPWCLGVSDAFRINSIRKDTSLFTSSSQGLDVTTNFNLDNGQRDTHYGLAWISPVAGVTVANNEHLLVNLDYFEHDFSQGIGYCSVDSYPIDDVNTANTSAITTAEIPIFNSTSAGSGYDLRNCIDFRPNVTNTANNSSTVSGATTNPSETETFYVPTGGLRSPAVNETFQTDLSYYLSRRDLVCIDNTGIYRVVNGISSLYPVTPDVPANMMALASIYIPPYPSLIASEGATYGKRSVVKISPKHIRRYTMRDIGVIDQSVKLLQYYQALSTLEKKAVDLKILDNDGLDRFKNGILVDSFTGTNIADPLSPEFKCSIDPTNNECRPLYDMTSVLLIYDSSASSNVQKTGNLVTLPYTHELYMEQQFASTTRNASGFFYNWQGNLTLDPFVDTWTDTTVAPEVRMNFDNNADAWLMLANSIDPSPWQTQWGAWQTLWTGEPEFVRSETSTQTNLWWGINNRFIDDSETGGRWLQEEVLFASDSTTTTDIFSTQMLQQRSGTTSAPVITSVDQSIGNRIIDVALQPFMRSRVIKFTATGLKPNTKLYPFFDGVDVSEYCYQTEDTTATSLPTTNDLISDSSGNIVGIFLLPNTNVRRFAVGTKQFKLTDNVTNDTAFGNFITSAEADYTASGLQQTQQNTILSTQQISVEPRAVTETRNINQQTTVVTSDVQVRVDPVAQSCIILSPDASGMFLSKVDLYFQSKSSTLPVVLTIREMENANLVSHRIVPYSTVVKQAADVLVSDDATIATTFIFDSLVYLMHGKTYALHILPASNSPDYRIWTGKLGQVDVSTGQTITKQPFAGSLFASSNDTVWNAVQDEDIKCKIYRANFNTSVIGSLRMNNQDIEMLTMNSLTGSYNIGNEPLWGETRLTVSSLSGGTPSVGQKIYQAASDLSGTITNISGSTYRVKLSGITDEYLSGQSITFRYANNQSTGATANVASIAIPKGRREYAYANTLHIFDVANTSFVVGEQVLGRWSNVVSNIVSFDEYKINVYNPNISQLEFPKTSIIWSSKLTSNTGTLQTSWNNIVVNNNNYLTDEMAIYSASEDTKSLQTKALMTSTTNYLSPAVDVSKCSVILVHNIINNDSTGETNPFGGNAKAKYIHRAVRLKEGQDAEDMIVRFTAFRPLDSNIKVYGKFIHGEDSDILDDINWIELELDGEVVNSVYENRNNFIEYTYMVPTDKLTGSNGELQYTNTNGITFTGYITFVVKIVMLSSNSSLVPRIKDLQILALQK